MGDGCKGGTVVGTVVFVMREVPAEIGVGRMFSFFMAELTQ